MLASAAVLLGFMSELTFWRDEWAFILNRRGFSVDTFLDPHYEHIAIAPIAIYKLLLAIFGMGSPLPFQLAAVTMFLGAVLLLFVWLRKRVSEWLALAAVLPLLFFGPSWDDLLWPFQIGFYGSLIGGIGALLALDRNDRKGDRLACGLLALGMTFSSLGIAFAAGVAVSVAIRPDRLRRAYVAAIPIGLFGLWWLGWGREADSFLSFNNLATLPSYVLDGLSSSLSSLFGLATPRDEITVRPLDWGRPLLAGFALLAVLRLIQLRRVPQGCWVIGATAISFWALAGLNASIFRFPESGRYQLMGAIFMVMFAAELLRGMRVPRGAMVAAVCIAAIAAASNLNYLHQFWNSIKQFGDLQPAGLAALEIGRGQIPDDFELTEENSDVDYLGELDAGPYYSAVDAFGSPAYTPEELAGASEAARTAADKVFGAAYGLGLEAVSGASRPVGRCDEVDAGTSPVVPVGPGGVALDADPGGDVQVRLRRYATTSFPVDAGTLAPGTRQLTVPQDASTQPWELLLTGSGRVGICELAG